jgi:hypothetical protein
MLFILINVAFVPLLDIIVRACFFCLIFSAICSVRASSVFAIGFFLFGVVVGHLQITSYKLLGIVKTAKFV